LLPPQAVAGVAVRAPGDLERVTPRPDARWLRRSPLAALPAVDPDEDRRRGRGTELMPASGVRRARSGGLCADTVGGRVWCRMHAVLQ
jgi:hypothetical protein